ncbi:heavy-metal-associated domain-containing protein [Pandoraea sputorum]|uniref:Copper-ion-binding protein n=1 Tax=Pandoraea sputorum TaxID=93222 RepID=A0A239SCR3_9BURK|nr:cation transporter [Pandoraea sputorum]AJC16445.1 heavy metal transporter [Pandoraea sputorum]SNU83197.1 Copper-ion-binding protein [Pandoraea sputorum]VVE16034.1 heavy metal transporter [Pandoraea sputorum]VVE82873.1 heavy metal transporter [Pandoraea sputorum]BET10922.1 cation transporter [Pandoraea sputorum]
MQVQVEGMSCGHCVKAVTRAITELDADAKVNVDLGAGRVDVQSDLSPAQVSAAITDAGYTVKGTSV